MKLLIHDGDILIYSMTYQEELQYCRLLSILTVIDMARDMTLTELKVT